MGGMTPHQLMFMSALPEQSPERREAIHQADSDWVHLIACVHNFFFVCIIRVHTTHYCCWSVFCYVIHLRANKVGKVSWLSGTEPVSDTMIAVHIGSEYCFVDKKRSLSR